MATDTQQTPQTIPTHPAEVAAVKKPSSLSKIRDFWKNLSKNVFVTYLIMAATVVIYIFVGLSIMQAILVCTFIIVSAIMSLREVWMEDEDE